MDEEFREILLGAVLDAYEKKRPIDRMAAFAECYALQSGMSHMDFHAYKSELCTLIGSLLHVAHHNPVWLKMVVEDSQFVLEVMGRGTDIEKVLDDITTFYPKRMPMPS